MAEIALAMGNQTLRKRATIRDVAALAGMSTLTVSRVINDHRSIKNSTRMRVESAMRELNYLPSASAQAMRRGTTRTVGFLMPDFGHGVSAVVARHVEQVLHRAGYSLMLACSHFDAATEVRSLNDFMRYRVAAVLLKTCDEGSPEIVACVRSMACPVLLVDRDMAAEVDSVVSDHAVAVEQAVAHLVALGHRDIALVAPSAHMRPGRARIDGFQKAMHCHGLLVSSGRLLDGGPTAETAEAAVADLIEGPILPTALIAGGNHILYGALDALKRHGVIFPRDISLIGADHAVLGRVMTPEITMIDRDPVHLAKTTAELLLDRLEGRAPSAPQRIVLSPRMLRGSSCRSV